MKQKGGRVQRDHGERRHCANGKFSLSLVTDSPLDCNPKQPYRLWNGLARAAVLRRIECQLPLELYKRFANLHTTGRKRGTRLVRQLVNSSNAVTRFHTTQVPPGAMMLSHESPNTNCMERQQRTHLGCFGFFLFQNRLLLQRRRIVLLLYLSPHTIPHTRAQPTSAIHSKHRRPTCHPRRTIEYCVCSSCS